jgi:hypothetical protein
VHDRRSREVTEQTKTGEAREAFVEELGPLFNMWGDQDGRECMRADLIEAGPAEVAQQFRKTADLLEGLANNAEDFIGFGAARVLVDAGWVAEEACAIAEGYAKEEERANREHD